MTMRVPRNVEDVQIPVVALADSFATAKRDVHLAKTARVRTWVRVKTDSVFLPEKVVALIVKSPRIFHEFAIGLSAGQESAWRQSFYRIISSLVIDVSMGGYGERELLRSQPEFVHERKHNLLGRLCNSGVYQNDLVAYREILKKVSLTVERLKLIDVTVELHSRRSCKL
jgi:hypothetical protein